MREIKFRAWDKEKNKMIDNFAHISKEGRMYTIHHGYPEPTYIPMQYTGLKDKNGKEIYEGDIVENQHGKKGVYVWNDRREGWDVWYKDFSGFETMNEWTVIGDVHDNPELLK